MVPLAIIGVFVVAALFANVLSPADPEEQALRQRFTPPVWDERGTWTHVLGTDRLGRDLVIDTSVEAPRDAEIPMDAPVRTALDLLSEPVPA